MSGLRLMGRDEMRTMRTEAQAKYGDQWRDTLLLQMAEQIARLTKKVSDIEGGVTP